MQPNIGSSIHFVPQHLQDLRAEFARAWRLGERPHIETFLIDVPVSDQAAAWRVLLLAELEFRTRSGERPTRADYADRFAAYGSALDSLLAQALPDSAAGSTASAGAVNTVEVGNVAVHTDVASAAEAGQAKSTADGQRIARFQIVRVLGEGAFGTVYLARDPNLDREVAVKVPREGVLRTPQDHQRFLREAKASATLNHPHIGPVFEVGEWEGRPYIVLAFIEGKPLTKLIQSGKVTPRQGALVVFKIAMALHEAHQKGVIHRDLKPANIMINQRGEPVIMDFGLARIDRPDDICLTHAGVIMGSPAYMSPEQARGAGPAVGPASDIYSLGVVLYEILCGTRPFDGTVMEVIGKILHVEPEPPSRVRPGLEPVLDAICLRAMSKQVEGRYANMREFAAALRSYLQTATGTAPSPLQPADADDSLSRSQVGSSTNAVAEQLPSQNLKTAANRSTRSSSASLTSSSASSGKGRSVLIALAGGLTALLLMFGLIFFARTPTATVLVQVDVDTNNPALQFRLDDRVLPAAELTKPMELTVGSHTLVVTEGTAQLRQYQFEVQVGPNAQISLRESTTAPPVANATAAPLGTTATSAITASPTAVQKAPSVLLKSPPPVFEEIELEHIPLVAAPAKTMPQQQTTSNAAPVVPERKFVSLFNGRDLTGWKLHPTVAGHWRVEQGVLVGESSQFCLLYSERADYSDFHLRAEVQFNLGGNGGLHGRCSFTGKMENGGYELQVGGSDSMQTGAVFVGGGISLARSAERLVQPNEWGTLELIMIGQKLETRVNGKQVANISLRTQDSRSGHIALEVHDAKSRIAFRKIEICDLAPKPAGQAAAAGQVLFNGRDLTGWKPRTGTLQSWRVEPSEQVALAELVGLGDPVGVLVTESAFDKLDLTLEFQIGRAGNGGVFLYLPSGRFLEINLHTGPLTYQGRNLEPSCGGLYWYSSSGERVRYPERPVTLKPAGEWNRLRAQLIGHQLTVAINDETVQQVSLKDLVLLLERESDSGVTPPTLQVGLQTLAHSIRYRNVVAQPQPAFIAEAGFKLLFDGKSLDGWRGDPQVWKVVDGCIVGQQLSNPPERNTFLMTNEEYRNFELRLQCKLESGNSGVQFRSRWASLQSYGAIGPQVEIFSGKPYIWGSVIDEPVGKPHLLADPNLVAKVLRAGDFNDLIITCKGERITVTLNDAVTVDERFLMGDRGKIGLQLHCYHPNMKVTFRHIRLQTLP